jgi:uncharacterized repeat protein (TIGR03803 family)
MNKFNWSMKACGVFLLWATAAVALPAQTTVAPTGTFTTLHSFNSTNGANPYAGLVQGTNGKFYGTTRQGGANGYGTVFSITTGGILTTLHSFNGTDGSNPYAGLVQGTNGKFYGTTEYGGANGLGTVFSITTGGTLTTLHSFDGTVTDGANPYAGLIQGTNGKFYGTTAYGGTGNAGTFFSITASGELTTLHNFGDEDGAYPEGDLIQATDGKFYGTTSVGGAHPGGTVFKITPGGKLTTLYSFCRHSGCPDGATPYAGVVQAADGKFYGTTSGGGANSCGRRRCGTVFRLTAGGGLRRLHSFDGSDGSYPFAKLVQATDGNLYGTTYFGGANEYGTVFSITPSGTLTTLHSFDGTGGEDPIAGLVQDTDGNFYGTTYFGGANSVGTAFSLSVGLGPFVEAQPTSGAMGTIVKILGTSLTGSTSVTFNGTPATFTVVSGSEITTTVPNGATTGTVQVVTPGGTLSSNVPFQVK